LSDYRLATFCSGKGGAGKTVVSILFARQLARMGKRVAIVDVDFATPNVHSYLLQYLRQKPELGLMNVLEGNATLESSLTEIGEDQWKRHDDVGGGALYFLKGVEFEESGDALDQRVVDRSFQKRFDAMLESLGEMVDVILLDTAAGVFRQVTSFCMKADDVAIVTGVEGAHRADAMALLWALNDGSKPPPPLWVLPNKVQDKVMGNKVCSHLIKGLKMVSHAFPSPPVLPTFLGWLPELEKKENSGYSGPLDYADGDARFSEALREVTLRYLGLVNDGDDDLDRRFRTVLDR